MPGAARAAPASGSGLPDTSAARAAPASGSGLPEEEIQDMITQVNIIPREASNLLLPTMGGHKQSIAHI